MQKLKPMQSSLNQNGSKFKIKNQGTIKKILTFGHWRETKTIEAIEGLLLTQYPNQESKDPYNTVVG